MTTPTPDKLAIPEAAVEAICDVASRVWGLPIGRQEALDLIASILPHMPDRGYAEVGELPDAVRIPLHSLTADIEYLFGRVAANGSCAPAMANSALDRLRQVEAAIRALAPPAPAENNGEPPAGGDHSIDKRAPEAQRKQSDRNSPIEDVAGPSDAEIEEVARAIADADNEDYMEDYHRYEKYARAALAKVRS